MNNKGGINNLIRHENKLPHIPKLPGVYLITCTVTGKKYVGSSKNMNVRLGNYLCTTFHRAKTFAAIDLTKAKFEVLENCQYLTLQQRLKVELEYIIKLDTIYPNGLNKVCPVSFLALLPDGTTIPKKERSQPKAKVQKPKSEPVKVRKNPKARKPKPKYKTDSYVNVL